MDACHCCNCLTSFLSISPEPGSWYSSSTSSRHSGQWFVRTADFVGRWSRSQASEFSGSPSDLPTCSWPSFHSSCDRPSPAHPSGAQDNCRDGAKTAARSLDSPPYFSFLTLLSVRWGSSGHDYPPTVSSDTVHAAGCEDKEYEPDRPWEITVPLRVCERSVARPRTACNTCTSQRPLPSSSSALPSASRRPSSFEWKLSEVYSAEDRIRSRAQTPSSCSPAVSSPGEDRGSAARVLLGKSLCLYSWKLSWTAPFVVESLSDTPAQTLFILSQARSPSVTPTGSFSTTTSSCFSSPWGGSSAHMPLSSESESSPSALPQEKVEGLFLIAPLADLQGRSVSALCGHKSVDPKEERKSGSCLFHSDSLCPSSEGQSESSCLSQSIGNSKTEWDPTCVRVAVPSRQLKGVLEGSRDDEEATTGNSKQAFGEEPLLLLTIHSNLPLPELLRLFSFVVADLLRGTCIPRDLKLQTWRPFGAVSASKAPLQCGSSPSSLSTSFSPSCSSSDAFHNTQKCGESEGGSFFDVGHSLDQPAVSFSSLRPPLLLSEIGWCSWDAYGKHIAADSILRSASLVRPGWVLIDDGWQQCDPYPPYEDPSLGNQESITSFDGVPGVFRDFVNMRSFVEALNTALAAPSRTAAYGGSGVEEAGSRSGRGRSETCGQRYPSSSANHGNFRCGSCRASAPSSPPRVLLWHCLLGGWKGVSPSLARKLHFSVRERVLPTFPPGLQVAAASVQDWKREMSVLPVDAFPAFYDAFYSFLGQQGIHGTKVDNQAMAAYVSEGCTDGASAAAYTHTSLVSMHVANQAYMSRKERPKGPEALLTTFEPLAWKNAKPAKLSCGAQSNTINCMGVAVPNVYLGGVSLIVRSSEDHAFHGVEESAEAVARHIWHNATNSLWLSAFYVPDWDMFRLCAWHRRIHAVARVISGGPIYVSDPFEQLLAMEPKATESELRSFSPEAPWRRVLRKLRVPGTDLPIFARCTGIAMPTPDCLFVNPLKTCAGYKVVNTCAAGLLLAVFGLHDSGPRSYAALITLEDILPSVGDNALCPCDGALTAVAETTDFSGFLCTDLEEGWERESPTEQDGEKINAAPLHPQFGWTVAPVYFMTARLYGITPIFATGSRSCPWSFASCPPGERDASVNDALRVSLIGGRTVRSALRCCMPSSPRGFTASGPSSTSSPFPAASLHGVERGGSILSPYAPPLVFTAIRLACAEIQPSEFPNGGTEAEGCKTGQLFVNGRTDLEVGASPDQRSVRDEERRKAGEGGDAKEMTRQTKRVAKGVAFQLHEATRTCSILVWSEGPRAPLYCPPHELSQAPDEACANIDNNEQTPTTPSEGFRPPSGEENAHNGRRPAGHGPESTAPQKRSSDFLPIAFSIQQHTLIPLPPVQVCPHGGVLYELRVYEHGQLNQSGIHFLW